MTKHSLDEYRQTQLLGMSQAELLVMLFQGAIRFLHEAIALIETGRYDQSWRKFDRARRIVVHLCGTLNRDAGDLADKLAALYAFVIEQITIANARRDVQAAQNCIDILRTLKEGWEGIAVQTAAPVPADTTPATPVATGTLYCQA
ncbi:MAG: flagellar export chaperone FliS [Candidatus Zixiibacteriota bacterium]